MVSVMGAFCSRNVLLFQTHINYLGVAFPRHMARFSLEALFRSYVGGAFPIIAGAMYRNTGNDKFPVGWGCSIVTLIGSP